MPLQLTDEFAAEGSTLIPVVDIDDESDDGDLSPEARYDDDDKDTRHRGVSRLLACLGGGGDDVDEGGEVGSLFGMTCHTIRIIWSLNNQSNQRWGDEVEPEAEDEDDEGALPDPCDRAEFNACVICS